MEEPIFGICDHAIYGIRLGQTSKMICVPLWHVAGVADINQVLRQDVNLKRPSSDQESFKPKVNLLHNCN